MSWWQAWFTALARPHLLFYESLAQDTSITMNRAYLWLAIGGLFTGLGDIVARLIYGQAESPNPLFLIPFALLYPLLSIVIFVVIIAIANVIAKSLFKGGGVFKELIRPMAAFMAPLMIIMSIVGLIPVVRLANYGLQVYVVGLAILSVKAVHRIGWGEATVCCAIFMLSALQAICGALTIY